MSVVVINNDGIHSIQISVERKKERKKEALFDVLQGDVVGYYSLEEVRGNERGDKVKYNNHMNSIALFIICLLYCTLNVQPYETVLVETSQGR